MKRTPIQLTDMAPAWGLVTYYAEDSSIIRQWIVTGAEAMRVSKTNRAIPHLPDGSPCCTQEEWETGRVEVAGRPCLPGQAVINPDGWMMSNYGITEDAGRVVAKVMRIPPNEYEVRDGVVYLDDKVAADMGY